MNPSGGADNAHAAPVDGRFDGRKFSLNRNALVPTDTSRPCSHPPVAYMVHFGELLTRRVTPDVTWTCRLEGHEGGPGGNALVPTDTSRPCSHPPVAYMVHFGELLTRQVTPDVTWTCRLEGHEGGPGAKQATRERHKGCVRGVPHSLGLNSGDGRTAGGRDLPKM